MQGSDYTDITGIHWTSWDLPKGSLERTDELWKHPICKNLKLDNPTLSEWYGGLWVIREMIRAIYTYSLKYLELQKAYTTHGYYGPFEPVRPIGYVLSHVNLARFDSSLG